MFFQTSRRLLKLTLTFKLVRARDQTRLPCEFSADQFSDFWGIRWKPHFFVPGDLDLWPWHSNSSKRRTKHVVPVNLAQIRSSVLEIFHTQKSHSAKKQRYTVHCVW